MSVQNPGPLGVVNSRDILWGVCHVCCLYLRAWWNRVQLRLQMTVGVCVYHLAYYLWLFMNDLIHWKSSPPAKQRGALPGRAPWILLFGELSCQWPYLLCQWWFMLAAATGLQPQVHLLQNILCLRAGWGHDFGVICLWKERMWKQTYLKGQQTCEIFNIAPHEWMEIYLWLKVSN